jgi:4-hydroxy-3-methylbut-2-enyl diphosphate reductase IspH
MSLAFYRTLSFFPELLFLLTGYCFSVQLTVPLCLKASSSVFNSVYTAEIILHQHQQYCLLCTDSVSAL